MNWPWMLSVLFVCEGFVAFCQGGSVGVRQSLLVATAILVVFIVSVGANVASVNAGRPHPFSTGGPGNCIEGQASVQEWCPGQEYKTWKRAMVCINGQLVPQTQDCTTETQTQTETAQCTEGTKKDVTYCEKDPTREATYWACMSGHWHLVQNHCPSCVEGQVTKVVTWCPNDATKWAIAEVCEGGNLVQKHRPCQACTPGQKGDCIQYCGGGGCDLCEIRWVCSNDGIWNEEKEHECFGLTSLCCFIATATYGSGLSPEVQLLRNFRDRDVFQTFAGSNFMRIFNMVYYSFSPQVAHTISTNENLRTMMRYVLYPLIGILWATQQIYSASAFSPEGAVVIAGVFAGSLIGLVYASPLILVGSFAIARAFRRRPTRAHVYMLLPFLAIATSLIIVSELTRFEMLMQVSTSMLMLTTWALPGLALSAWVLNKRSQT